MHEAKLTNSRAQAVQALAEHQGRIVEAANAQLKDVNAAIDELARYYAAQAGLGGDAFFFEQHPDGLYVVAKAAAEPEQDETR